jgi:beta-lactamase class A
MSRVPQAHYYVPGRERPQRSLASRFKFPVLTVLVLAGAGYCGYVYRQQIPGAPLASATADTSVVAQRSVSPTVSPVKTDVQKVEPATVVAPDLSAVITRTGLSQNRASTWSVAVYDITNKRWIAQVNPDQQIFSASLYKLYVVYGLSKSMPFNQWSTKQVGGHSVKDCVDLMLRISDNNCGIAVGGLVGWNKVDKEANKYGFTRTDMAKPGGSVTTATDTTNFMSDLYQGKLFDADTTTFILNSLKDQTYRSGVPAGCPTCTVYNKTGNENGVAHDSAIVQDGKYTYAVTVMSEGGSPSKIANIERSLETALKAVH